MACYARLRLMHASMPPTHGADWQPQGRHGARVYKVDTHANGHGGKADKGKMAKVGDGFQVGLSWVPMREHGIPFGAIQVDRGIFVARGEVNGEKIPGKYVEKYRTCYVPYGGKEHELNFCDILCDTSVSCDGSCYKWVADCNGDVPKKAIVAGLASDGEPLYVCKASFGGEMCVGKVHGSHSCAYIPHGGEEHSVENYEVLVLRK
ncbi:hypothetical protein TcWFU_001910 [Taenia crassiceps]|uniref:DUF3421 domain-containing protein n=1 Tax=Taenia crassiceps TaxID=6207 RepID=A0ABR4QFZ7_9CEST